MNNSQYDDEDDQDSKKLRKIKALRPLCPYGSTGKHAWIVYSSRGIQRCHDCKYTEPLVYVGQ